MKMPKKQEKKKPVLERTYNVPLRKEFMKAPKWKRTPRAVKALKEFMIKHMKSDNVKIGKYANKELWKHGMKNPPHHIKVNAVKDDEGLVKVELVGAPKEEPKLEKPKKAEKKEKKTAEEKKAEKLEGAVEEAKEEKAEKAKEIEKEEIKEMKKEKPAHAPKQPAIPKNVEQHPTAPMNR